MTSIRMSELESDFITFDTEGQETEGLYIDQDTIQIGTSDVLKITLLNDMGQVSFLCTYKLLKLFLKLPYGVYVKIRYEGLLPTKSGRNMKDFKMWVNDDDLEIIKRNRASSPFAETGSESRPILGEDKVTDKLVPEMNL